MLADEMATNETDVEKAVRDGAGMTVSEYIHSFRIDHAEYLLSNPADNNNIKISKIANVCGFSNRMSFYRDFVARYGVTPSECRRKAMIDLSYELTPPPAPSKRGGIES